ncbi:MAG: glycosyltransferase [Deltaproteobacteria bacterium]|nr:MAG: glycosyltransferase [Deltaproteobacteria bacterium]
MHAVTELGKQRRVLAMMAKAPHRGEVKTRLIPACTVGEAALLQRAFLLDLLEHPWPAVVERQLWLAGQDETLESEAIALGWAVRAQGEGDLGERMRAVFVSEAPSATLVIGADVPHLRSADVEGAWGAIEAGSLVLGPAVDGGYWAIGTSRPEASLFTGIPWSTSQVLTATIERANALELPVTCLPTRRDVDDVADLARLWQHLNESRTAAVRHTRRALDELLRTSPLAERMATPRKGS